MPGPYRAAATGCLGGTTLEKISNDVNERSDGKLPAVLYGDTNIVDEKGSRPLPTGYRSRVLCRERS